jgi:hypothetical protein
MMKSGTHVKPFAKEVPGFTRMCTNISAHLACNEKQATSKFIDDQD